MGAHSCGVGGERTESVNGHKRLCRVKGGDGNALKMDFGDDCATVNLLKVTELYI